MLFDTQDGVLGTNMYAYCQNSPITYYDPSGMLLEEIFNFFTGKVDGFYSGASQVFNYTLLVVGIVLGYAIFGIPSLIQQGTRLLFELPCIYREDGANWSLSDIFASWVDWRYLMPKFITESNNVYVQTFLALFVLPLGAAGGGGLILQFWPTEGLSNGFAGALNDLWNAYQGKGAWHAMTGWFLQWQRFTGFNDMYDMVFKLFASCDRAKFTFKHTSDEYGTRWYTLWAWKGDYYTLGLGCEIGLYWANRECAFQWNTVESKEFITADIKLYYGEKDSAVEVYPGTEYQYDCPPPNWWVTVFLPDKQGCRIQRIGVQYVVTFPSVAMHDSFKGYWPEIRDERLKYLDNDAVRIYWPAGWKN